MGRANVHVVSRQKTASDYLFEAVADAEESHQDEIAARALAMLTYVRGSGLSRYEEGISIGRLAEAAIRRIGSPDAILADLAQARGWVEYTHGNLEAALPLRREAIERHRRALGDADPDALQMKAELGISSTSRGISPSRSRRRRSSSSGASIFSVPHISERVGTRSTLARRS